MPFYALAAVAMAFPGQVLAQDEGQRAIVAALESRIAEQEHRIADLERLVGDLIEQGAPAPAANAAAVASTAQHTVASLEPANAAPPVEAIASADAPKLIVSGDLRLREEFNWSDRNARDRSRSALRARLRAQYAVNEAFTVGAQLDTGDPDDPNSVDKTLGDFVDDLTVSLDQAYVRYSDENLVVWGGKFPNPLRRTDLIWDGDVSPQGLAAVYSHNFASGVTAQARGLYFLLNESVAEQGSDMLGFQAGLTFSNADWSIELNGGYLDYRFRDIDGADSGDFRSNLRSADGSFLSDFNLGEVLASASYFGLDERWPVTLTGHIVHNFGAAVDAEDGFLVSTSLGRSSQQGDWQFSYVHAEAENEAVLAAFSNDNLTIATNYKLHALSLDHVVHNNTILNLLLYRFRPLDPAFAAPNQADDWLNRLRINLLYTF